MFGGRGAGRSREVEDAGMGRAIGGVELGRWELKGI